jgi:hypothetical protein
MKCRRAAGMSESKQRPILFSAAMVRALLAGTKTQTRRALKHQPIDIIQMPEPPAPVTSSHHRPIQQWVTLEQRVPEPRGKVVRCRFGIPGDSLWVRETWQRIYERHDGQRFTEARPGFQYRRSWIEYAATSSEPPPKWRPSIHMPRAHCRIILRITDIRVERLQDITEADAMAEGIIKVGQRWEADGIVATPDGARDAYKSVWNYINGRDAWDANPWVWALSFERVAQVARAAA